MARPQRGHINIIHHQTGFKADVYLTSRDPLHAWGLSRSVEIDLGGEIVCFAPAEYVIVRKLEFFREGGSVKHLRDIHRMITSLGNDWSQSDLKKMISALHLEKEWALAEQFTG